MRSPYNARVPEHKYTQSVQSFYEPALRLLQHMMEKNKARLRKGNYPESNAAVKREDFREQMHHRFRIAIYLTYEIEKSLSKAGLVEFVGSGFLKPKDGGV
ncbi:hypothetical protein [Acinetobacter stercoris]|uniref:Uncharacterized protein n=1 Tax=Acinetobacter stercoris TaxID=2126983 RepID=A0A2U3N3W3_9GAMM|nr:hypothetical protein [Acinetobacter stercoris]SPL72295.1 hypothetical protein KPC_3473 [Acinetobacter stercoris]